MTNHNIQKITTVGFIHLIEYDDGQRDTFMQYGSGAWRNKYDQELTPETIAEIECVVKP